MPVPQMDYYDRPPVQRQPSATTRVTTPRGDTPRTAQRQAPAPQQPLPAYQPPAPTVGFPLSSAGIPTPPQPGVGFPVSSAGAEIPRPPIPPSEIRAREALDRAAGRPLPQAPVPPAAAGFPLSSAGLGYDPMRPAPGMPVSSAGMPGEPGANAPENYGRPVPDYGHYDRIETYGRPVPDYGYADRAEQVDTYGRPVPDYGYYDREAEMRSAPYQPPDPDGVYLEKLIREASTALAPSADETLVGGEDGGGEVGGEDGGVAEDTQEVDDAIATISPDPEDGAVMLAYLLKNLAATRPGEIFEMPAYIQRALTGMGPFAVRRFGAILGRLGFEGLGDLGEFGFNTDYRAPMAFVDDEGTQALLARNLTYGERLTLAMIVYRIMGNNTDVLGGELPPAPPAGGPTVQGTTVSVPGVPNLPPPALQDRENPTI